jgi:hypothetical protein
MPPGERAAAREAAVELRDELARLDLVAAVAARLLQPPAYAARSRAAHVNRSSGEPFLTTAG